MPSELLGHEFADAGLLDAALTHRSAGNPNNERLEFFGDAVLDMVISRELYERRPNDDEGTLTRLRAHLVRGESLADVARELGLGERIQLGPGELRSGGHRRDSILAGAFEAALGAICLDAGYPAVERCIMRIFADRLANLPDAETLKDSKTRLQEWLQGRNRPLPRYRVIDEVGPPHKRVFSVRCELQDEDRIFEASGRSRRRAEHDAAAGLLDSLMAE